MNLHLRDRPSFGEPVPYVVDGRTQDFEMVAQMLSDIEAMGNEFLAGREGAKVSSEHKQDTYTAAPDYFAETMAYHKDPWVIDFLGSTIRLVHQFLEKEKGGTLIDAGCAFGVTGLCFAMAGIPVVFHDFEGLSLEFLRWLKEKNPQHDIEVIPYGQPIRKQKVCVAFDVLEHTGNHLATLKWLKELGDLIIVTWPTRVPFREPYQNSDKLDEWVDDDALLHLIAWRYQLLDTRHRYEWRSVIFG